MKPHSITITKSSDRTLAAYSCEEIPFGWTVSFSPPPQKLHTELASNQPIQPKDYVEGEAA